eukprot:6304683-Pyramimonas_sp.AAC.1
MASASGGIPRPISPRSAPSSSQMAQYSCPSNWIPNHTQANNVAGTHKQANHGAGAHKQANHGAGTHKQANHGAGAHKQANHGAGAHKQANHGAGTDSHIARVVHACDALLQGDKMIVVEPPPHKGDAHLQ